MYTTEIDTYISHKCAIRRGVTKWLARLSRLDNNNKKKITTEQRVREKESSKSNNGYGLIDIKFVE